LPDGVPIFEPKTPTLGKFWRGLAMEAVGLSYGSLVYLMAIWYMYLMAIWHTCWLFGIFFPCWFVVQRKNLATLLKIML
jgi:hypothetical protein